MIDNPIRGLVHPPEKLFNGWLKPGMTAIDAGCGTGYFSLAMARIVGEEGRVVGVDVQPEALSKLEARAETAGLHRVIETWKCESADMGALPRADFILAFYMAHEVPDIDRFFDRMYETLAPEGSLFLTEPSFHISEQRFAEELASAVRAGLETVWTPQVRFSRSAILKKA